MRISQPALSGHPGDDDAGSELMGQSVDDLRVHLPGVRPGRHAAPRMHDHERTRSARHIFDLRASTLRHPQHEAVVDIGAQADRADQIEATLDLVHQPFGVAVARRKSEPGAVDGRRETEGDVGEVAEIRGRQRLWRNEVKITRRVEAAALATPLPSPARAGRSSGRCCPAGPSTALGRRRRRRCPDKPARLRADRLANKRQRDLRQRLADGVSGRAW